VERLALGSVSSGVVSKAACPLLVVPGGERSWPPTRVVAGEDLSETSAAASALAAAIGGVYGLPMTLVNAYPLLEFGHKARISGVFRVNAEVRAASRRLKRLARELEGDLGRRPEVKVSIGNAADAILQEAEGDDRPVLISTGSRRLGTLDRFRVGSVSARILRSASGPVLIHRDRNG
jgi:nucleotide-binding universal stress UspA family protein